ncbi:hypothetical protein AB0I69_16305 [Streptomyces sp. NPDC050508]|uniref:hypothetical protein n=1 Tax=Streptomyces sp. NPDC050508 TaxID=3155405 RepID=UPI00343A5BF9
MTSKWARWSADKDEHWLEVYGETEPLCIPLERLFATGPDAAHPFTAYLYVWTLGYKGDAPRMEVSLLFPATGSWQVKDLQAVVYHLPPVQKERRWRAALAKDLRTAAPVLEVAGKVTADLTGFPELNAAAAATAHLNARSAPQARKNGWYVKRVHGSPDGALCQGVKWVLPPSFVKQIGIRVTGALLVQFVEAAPAHEGNGPQGSSERHLLACATFTRGKKWIPWGTRSPVDAHVRLPLVVAPEELTHSAPAQCSPCPDPPPAPAASPTPTTTAAAATTPAPPPLPPPRH